MRIVERDCPRNVPSLGPTILPVPMRKYFLLGHCSRYAGLRPFKFFLSLSPVVVLARLGGVISAGTIRKRVLVLHSKTSHRRRRSPPEHGSICASSNCDSEHITTKAKGPMGCIGNNLCCLPPVHEGDDDDGGGLMVPSRVCPRRCALATRPTATRG